MEISYLNKMKKIFYTIIIVFAAYSLTAQQAQYTQYMFNLSNYNPSYTASDSALTAFAAGRQQWAGFKDTYGETINPREIFFRLEMPLYDFNSNIGISYQYDKLALWKNSNLKLNYAYRHKLKQKHILSYGLALEFINTTIDFNKLHSFNDGDPVLLNASDKGTTVDLELGLNYVYNNRLYVGISGVRLLNSKLPIAYSNIQNQRMFYFNAAYDIPLNINNRKSLIITPGFLVKKNSITTQVEANVIVNYMNKYWAGLSYRQGDAVGLLAGINIFNFALGLSYDYNIYEGIRTASIGSPEIFIKYSYKISPKIKKQGYYNPRYL